MPHVLCSLFVFIILLILLGFGIVGAIAAFASGNSDEGISLIVIIILFFPTFGMEVQLYIVYLILLKQNSYQTPLYVITFAIFFVFVFFSLFAQLLLGILRPLSIHCFKRSERKMTIIQVLFIIPEHKAPLYIPRLYSNCQRCKTFLQHP